MLKGYGELQQLTIKFNYKACTFSCCAFHTHFTPGFNILFTEKLRFKASRFKEKKIFFYSAFQIDEPHRHHQNPAGAIRESPLLWSTEMKTAVNNYLLFQKK
ncbi:MAG: hypothetical protein F6K22_33275 [Okeania sp. SIO2F4]|uniref:hypothetical protein n=1 Tax=Okeania sp. SIO2F4 TaxID=2607790 RepID=UPI00142AC729|nr:hypothetical protein [Okeania sp. SIO2F4]NES07240.1 hypothetical protein [Okeania sp. SIO2F4]